MYIFEVIVEGTMEDYGRSRSHISSKQLLYMWQSTCTSHIQYSLYYRLMPWCTTIAPPTRGWSTCVLKILWYHLLHPYFRLYWWNYTISCIFCDALEHTRILSCGVVIPVHLYTCVTVNTNVYILYVYYFIPLIYSSNPWSIETGGPLPYPVGQLHSYKAVASS